MSGERQGCVGETISPQLKSVASPALWRQRAAMNVTEAVAARRSTRAFLDTPVDPALLRTILAKALQAPSNSNIQPWLVHVVAGEPLQRLVAATASRSTHPPVFDKPAFPVYPDPIAEPHAGRRFACGERQYGTRGIAREDQAGRLDYVYNNVRFFGAPTGLFLFTEPGMGNSQWADLGIFLQTVMLLLTEAGIDCCAQICWTLMHRTVAETLGIDPRLELYCGLSIGYRDPADPINTVVADRAAFEEVVTFHGL